jgi:acetolactate synthase small subunit
MRYPSLLLLNKLRAKFVNISQKTFQIKNTALSDKEKAAIKALTKTNKMNLKEHL